MRVYQRNKRWWVDFSYKGKRFRRSAGRTKREALLKLGEIQKRIDQEDIQGIRADAQRSFLEYSKEYLRYSKSNKAPSSHRRNRTSMKQLVNAFRDRTLRSIKAGEIERYKQIRKEQVSSASVNRELALLKHMYHKAVDWGYVVSNPVRKVVQRTSRALAIPFTGRA